jgi:nitrosocyanin
MDETTETPKKGNSMMMVLGVVVLLVIVGIAFVMMKNKSQTELVKQEELSETESQEAAENSNTAMTQTDGSSASATTDNGTVKTFTIEAGSFYYKPNAITVKKGDKVKIVMNSVDMMHDFNIDELKVKLPITKSGETNTVEFTADTAGTFEFYCSVGQHRANGQVGTLIVEE